MEQTRKEQISALAHDLKTPLTLIRGNAGLLYEIDPTAEQIECIGYIEDSPLQMQDYVQMLININTSNHSINPQALIYATTQFYMDNQSRNSKTYFGIGLYVADSIVKQHGGRLNLENDMIAYGVIVTIEIPV